MFIKKILYFSAIVMFASVFGMLSLVSAHQPLDGFEAHPPVHVRGGNPNGRTSTFISIPSGLSPTDIKNAYNLSGSGTGTIAIVDAYDNPNAESDLNVFSSQFGLPSCTTANGCFEKHRMIPKVRSDAGWALEESLDVEWAHAIAPGAKILLVVAKSASGNDLLSAVDYARKRSGVVAVSMSWGGGEFAGESSYNSYFTSPTSSSITFFAASGDSGTGVQWPAVSPNVVGVGGTTLAFTNGQVSSETAWSGSGGGVSQYETEPSYQTTYGVPQANGKRAVPDVSYNADYQNSGVSVYDSFGYQGVKGWFVVGGTSAGAPQWAAIKALGGTTSNTRFYQDAVSSSTTLYFRDIVSGTNGTCGFYCTAQSAYDYVTGLGSPLTTSF